MNEFQIWYLYHSSFAIKHGQTLMIFDYYNDLPTNQVRDLDHGVINPEEIKDLDVYVFVSHGHYDHYNSIIFTWQDTIKSIHYIISDDISIHRNTDNITTIGPNQTMTVGCLKVHTLLSNDKGVAFIVSSLDKTFFHSGDLNWWVGKNPVVNAEDERILKAGYEIVKTYNVDVAFIPISPKLGEHYSLSTDYFLKHIAKSNCLLFPMHFGLNLEIFRWLERDGFLEDPRLQVFMHRGRLPIKSL